jgi:hypothetical protein
MHGITTIELGGEKRIIAINMHCLIFLSKELKCNPDEIDEKIREVCIINPLRGLTYIIYCGLLGHLESEAIFLHDITLKQVSTWIGDAPGNEFKSVWDTFSDVMAIPKATQEQIDEYAKRAEEKIKAGMSEIQIKEYDERMLAEKKN